MDMDGTLDQGSTFDLNDGTETHSIFVKLQENAFQACQSIEVRFASFLSSEFTTMAVINPPERKLAKHISVKVKPVLTSHL